MTAPSVIAPPFERSADGSPRQVGVEIEFGGLDCRPTAELVARQFGGEVTTLDEYRFLIESPGHGRFVVELDTQFVHPRESEDPEARAKLERERLGDYLEASLRSAIGEVTRIYLPVEVICPPLPIARLGELDELAASLREAGARGTRESVVYAFGLQLNPDLPALDVDTVLRYLRAYLVSADWLRRDIGIDLTRRVLPFVQPYPRSYLRKVLPADYTPDMATLIEDYLFYNPTRNRDLDMLPLFLWLAPERVRGRIDDPRLKARPALHYRLPDCRIDEPDWSITEEWNRWARTVERLAADPERLQDTCEACLNSLGEGSLTDWAEDAVEWLLP